ncbi:hypothetical protein RUM43_009310 [Polyplax serrata]|uniref:Uncharacterized protein n=1 Tax=Polyplax serrata TaxID=468196 RepID=A0AAN8PAM6_POLSC
MADVTANGEAKPQNGEAEKNESDSAKLHEQILKQVEYYFGDINLPKDKFMLEQIKQNDGWIPMSVMMKFQRLAKLSTDPKVIASALEPSELMEVDDTGEELKIRRSPGHPLTEITDEKFKELQMRSIYCKGFPLDYTMNDLIEFFNAFGAFENIIMRKYKDKLTKSFKFKGSVFVTYATKEKAKEFLDLPDVKCKDKELIRMWQLEQIEQKKQEILTNKLKRSKKAGDAAGDEKELKESFPKGATLHLQGDYTNLTREDIKEAFNKLGYETAFVAFNKGEKEAHIRLNREDAGKDFVEKEGKEIDVAGSKLEARLLEGEEEEQFLRKAMEDRNAYLKKCQQARQGGRRGGKGGKGRGKNMRKRKGSIETSDAPSAKKTVVAE